MRFDDRLATVLRVAPAGAREAALKWRQLVDLLAQGRGESAHAAEAYAYLRTERARLPVAERMGVARSIAGQQLAPDLLLFFAADHAAVAAPVIRAARLAPAEWLTLLPTLGPTARALLRHRRDLHPEVAAALARFGASDLVLEAQGHQAAAEGTGEGGGSQIRHLVARIEAFRQQRELNRPPPPLSLAPSPGPEPHRWESDAAGILRWTDAEPRGAFVGLALARPADKGGREIAEALARHAPFRELPLTLANGTRWLLSAVPSFDTAGAFTGYRGTARAAAEDARADAPSPLMMREMVHELRTPLNAILGFAEMIDGQYLGPATEPQRARATRIRQAAHGLLAALEDLDLGARQVEGEEKCVDLASILHDIHDAAERDATERGVALRFLIAPDLAPARCGREIAARLVTRLVGTSVAVAQSGGTVEVRLHRQGGEWLQIAGSVQGVVAARGETIDFTILASLANGAGGRIRGSPDGWSLRLPMADKNSARSSTGG